MTEMDKYYQNKDTQDAATKISLINDEIDKNIRLIIPASQYVLKCYKQNPPEQHSWESIEGKKVLAWTVFYKHSTGSGRDRDYTNEVSYLLEDGRIFYRLDDYRDSPLWIDTRDRNLRITKFFRISNPGFDYFSHLPTYYSYAAGAFIGEARKLGASQGTIDSWYTNAGFDNPNKSDIKTKKSGCYIATAVYGSYDAPEVRVLRRFRDEVLQKSFFGRLFISAYYKLSPPVAERLKGAKQSNHLVKSILDRWVERLRNTRAY